MSGRVPGEPASEGRIKQGQGATLVEMPLLFLKKEDIAQEGLGLNAFTEEVYT